MATERQKNKRQGSLWQYIKRKTRIGTPIAPKNSKAKDIILEDDNQSPNDLAMAAHVSLNCVIFGYSSTGLNVLVQTIHNSTDNKICSLPGYLVRQNEDFDEAAESVAIKYTGIKDIKLQPLGTFKFASGSDIKEELQNSQSSLKIKPTARVIQIAYFGVVNLDDQGPLNKDGAVSTWHSVKPTPTLAFGHGQILKRALEGLRFKVKYYPLAFELLPQKFTLGEAQKVYEAILNTKLDKRNFRRKLEQQNLIIAAGEKQKDVAHKPAMLYQFNSKAYNQDAEGFLPFS